MKVTTLVTKAEWPHSWLLLWAQTGAYTNEMWLIHNCPPTPNERYLKFLPIAST